MSQSEEHPVLDLYWIKPDSREEFKSGELILGEKYTLWINSHIGHEFKLVDAETNEVTMPSPVSLV